METKLTPKLISEASIRRGRMQPIPRTRTKEVCCLATVDRTPSAGRLYAAAIIPLGIFAHDFTILKTELSRGQCAPVAYNQRGVRSENSASGASD